MVNHGTALKSGSREIHKNNCAGQGHIGPGLQWVAGLKTEVVTVQTSQIQVLLLKAFILRLAFK